MSNTSIKVAVSAGELSGDQHAAELIRAIAENDPENHYEFAGMGGNNLADAGMRIVVPIDKYGKLNGFNLFKILWNGLYCLIKMLSLLLSWQPKILILIDYPDFNLRLAKLAKLLGVRTVYFIPPKLWAWRQGRVKAFKKHIDHTLCIFPFEKEFFEKHGYSAVSYVGHPFNTAIKPRTAPKNDELTIVVLPGSRTSEIKRHLKPVLEALNILKKEHPQLKAIVPLATGLDAKLLADISSCGWIELSKRDSREIMAEADFGILKSGTCNLEAAFLNLPFICFYKSSGLAAWIVRNFVKIKEYSLVNILKSGTVTELIQEEANGAKIAEELRSLISDQAKQEKMSEDFQDVRNQLASEGSTYSQAAAFLSDLAKQTNIRTTIWARLYQRLLPYRKKFICALAAMVVFGATDGAIPLIVKHFLDDVFASQDKSMLYFLPVMLIALALVRAFSGFTQEYLMAKIGHNIVKDLRNQMHEHLLKLTPDYYTRHSSGNLLARFTSDVLLVKDFLTNSTAAVIRDAIRIVALVGTAIYLDPWLALLAVLVFPVGGFPIYHFGKRIRKLSKKGQDEIGSISALIQESVLGNRVIKLFNQEKAEQDKFEKSNHDLTKTFVKSEKFRALSNPVNELLAVLAICGVIMYGGHTVMSGFRSQGDFIAFLVAIFLMYDPFKKLSRVYHQIQQGASGAERIFEILDEEPSIQEAAKTKDFPGDTRIELKEVSFNYPDASEVALSNINLSIAPGEKVALVGFSGAGKSTLVDLFPRFIDPAEGNVTIGGCDLKDLKLADLRGQIAMVNQQTFLFNDTIANNIAYGVKDASKDAIESAAKAAYAHNFITQFPDSYDTIIGEDGTALSGGERQRLAIARAILKNSPILILDEATAALDNQSEREVQKALEELESGRTAIIIAHRLSTVRNADKIIVMEKGQIVETGTHDELIATGGVYLKLYKLQFQEKEVTGFLA